MYFAKDIGEIKSSQSFLVGIFRTVNGQEEQVGKYQRTSYTRQTTFFAFQKDNKDFALYSPRYSEIRIMELPSCKDIGCDESQPQEFCSIEFYVPSYMEQAITSRRMSAEKVLDEKTYTIKVSEPTDKQLTEYVEKSYYINGNTGEKEQSEHTYRPLTSRLYHPFGFVHGGYWMDDFTVHYLDLSEVEKGIIKRDARFGYVELSSKIPLKESINLKTYKQYLDKRENYIQMQVMQTFDLVTGKIIEPYE